MRHEFQPRLHPVPIADLRPTQMTVGMREVYRKRREWRDMSAGEDADFLGQHMLPGVLGPKGRCWIVDHHHLALALHKEGVKSVLVSTLADLSDLGKDEFLTFMDNRNWLHPFNGDGERRPAKDLPKRIWDLQDDPFRSLAGAVREAGGFAKESTPYTEFLWADFYRRRLKRPETDDDFDDAAEKALKLSRSKDARHLPGWVDGGK
ncbi:ParB-like protein [Rhizobium sp. C4]|uniref:ParB-like protein n=1 Tax=Rhizobium sp. C4 TaxID=1349800 RepID=UPI001E42F6B5|nr:ParB-like protein [Rhizobium sp. C4]MCD2174762.1 chromosome partitioning protein ParB [Rhizobium sp. C4]